MHKIWEPFNDAFTILLGQPAGSGVVPYLPEINNPVDFDWLYYHQIWFKNKKPKAGIPSMKDPQNYYHVIGAFRGKNDKIVYAGVSNLGSDISWVFPENIKDDCNANKQNAGLPGYCSANEIAHWTQHTTMHELTHQFAVNTENSGGDCKSDGHDRQEAWCSGQSGCKAISFNNLFCLMYRWGNNTALEIFRNKTSLYRRLDCNDIRGSDGVPCPGTPECHDHVRPRPDPN